MHKTPLGPYGLLIYTFGNEGVTPGMGERDVSNGWEMFNGHGV